MAQTVGQNTRIDWVSIVEDLFPRWRDRLGSNEAAKAKLRALFDDPETRLRIRRIDANGEEVPDTRRSVGVEFCQRHLSAVPDPDSGNDQIAVDYSDPYPDYYTPGGHWKLEVRRVDVECHERLNFPVTAASSPTHGHSAEAEPPRKRGRKERIQWDRIKTEMMRLMDHHGDFDPVDPEWNVQARLEEALKQYCQDKFGEEPSDGALRTKLPDWLDEWRFKKSQGISTSS